MWKSILTIAFIWICTASNNNNSQNGPLLKLRQNKILEDEQIREITFINIKPFEVGSHIGPKEMELQFSAFGIQFQFTLKRDDNVYSTLRKKREGTSLRYWNYRGFLTTNNEVEASSTQVVLVFVKNSLDSPWKGSFFKGEIEFRMDTGSHFDDLGDIFMGISKISNKNQQMLTEINKLIEHEEILKRRRRAQLVYWDDCWEGQNKFIAKIQIGVIVDSGFAEVVDNYLPDGSKEYDGLTKNEKIELYMIDVFNRANQLYVNQFDVFLEIYDMLITDGGRENTDDTFVSTSFFRGCSVIIDDHLASLATFLTSSGRNPAQENIGSWHLFTNCYPPGGTYGLGYQASLCKDNGVGLSNFLKDDQLSGTWTVFSHENGHVFGAGHSFEDGQGNTGGIMDYGDGTWQDVFQFNVLRKTEMCTVISDTMTDYPKAWSYMGNNKDFNNDPTVNKFLDHQNDNPEYAVEYENSVAGVSDYSDGFLYSWRKTGTYSECEPEIGGWKFQYMSFECEKVDLNSGEKSSASDAQCYPIQKPDGEFEGCSSSTRNHMVGTCGNGIIEREEECESSLQGTCCSDFCTWKTDGGCIDATNSLDAAFRTHSGEIYAFKGNQVWRYADSMEDGPDSGYPKTISTEFPNLPSAYTTELKGAVKVQPSTTVFNSEVYFFTSKNYVRYNYDTNVVVTDTALDVTDVSDTHRTNDRYYNNYASSSDVDSARYSLFLGSCGGVEAAIGFENHFLLFCESFYVHVEPNAEGQFSFLKMRPWTTLNLGFDPETVQSFINAAYYNPTSREARFFVGPYYQDWKGWRTEGPMATTPPLSFSSSSSDLSGSCPANCETCYPGSTECISCVTNFKLWGAFGCIAEENAVIVSFDQNDESLEATFLAGGEEQYADYLTNSKIVSGGKVGNGFSMDGTDVIDFAPVNLNFDSFQVEMEYKPTAQWTVEQRLFTFTDSVRTRIMVDLSPYSSSSTSIVVKFGGDQNDRHYTCVSSFQLPINSYTKLMINFTPTKAECTIGSASVNTPNFDGVDLTWSLMDWSIGDKYRGPKGMIDSVQLMVAGAVVVTGAPIVGKLKNRKFYTTFVGFRFRVFIVSTLS